MNTFHHKPDENPPGGTFERCCCGAGAGWLTGAAVEVGDGFAVAWGGGFVFVPSKIEDAFLPLSLLIGSGAASAKMFVCPPPGGLRTLLDGRVDSPKPMLKFVDVIFNYLKEDTNQKIVYRKKLMYTSENLT